MNMHSASGKVYKPADFIKFQYEADDQNSLLIKMKDETTGFGTRISGSQ